MKRTLFSSSKQCPLGCKYCFAGFNNYTEQKNNIFDSSKALSSSILYPSCDGELFHDKKHLEKFIDYLHNSEKSFHISVSIKSKLTNKTIAAINKMNDALKENDASIFKCSISITNREFIDEIEPYTSPYAHRISSLDLLKREGIFTSVNIRPILPFIDIREYKGIVDDAVQHSERFLLGGLYIDERSEFGSLVKKRYSNFISQRTVGWLDQKPTWSYCEDIAKTRLIEDYILAAGGRPFSSDVEVIEDMIESKSALIPNNSVGYSHSPIVLEG